MNFKLSSHSNSLGVLEKAKYIDKLKLVGLQCDCVTFAFTTVKPFGLQFGMQRNISPIGGRSQTT